jgi:hypothetical protein
MSYMHPSNEAELVRRYISVPKLLHLLVDNCLWFTRIDCLDDRLEGSIPPKVEAGYREAILSGVQGPSEFPIDRAMRLSTSISRKTRYVSCWCLGGEESEALWRIYAHPFGVALETSYSQLRSLTSSSQISIGLIKYRNMDERDAGTESMADFVMTKRRCFAHEREVRLVLSPQSLSQIASAASKPKFPGHVDLATLPTGLPVSIDAETLFQRIIVSPHAPEWFVGVIKKTVSAFTKNLPVARSSIQ